LNLAGVQPQARYVVYYSLQPGWWDSIDIAEALHPQTLIAYEMNGEDLPEPHGAPLRMKVPRQLGYKSVKHISRITVTDSLEEHWQRSRFRGVERWLFLVRGHLSCSTASRAPSTPRPFHLRQSVRGFRTGHSALLRAKRSCSRVG
jgi:DMSO/TMAO reductase YedYZ molybdopterin-dependent catalytic subunit